jgi:hypothetical protein
LLSLVACGEPSKLERMSFAGDYSHGKELVERYQCGQCHLDHVEGTCAGCHRTIARAAEHGEAAVIAEQWRSPAQIEIWRNRLVNMPQAPSLHAVGKLLRREWIARFLEEPHDLRPRLGATMPRLRIDERDARDVAAYLAEAEDEEPYFADERMADWTRSDPSSGRELYARLGCGTCHAFIGPDPGWTLDGRDARSLLLAPDLRFTRERFQPNKLVPWLLEPTHHKVDAVMPEFELSYADARDLAAYIMTEPVSEPAPRASPERLPLLDREVRYDEVYDKVLSQSCVHCHGDPDFATDGGGPGFSGGFGFKAIELSFASYEATLAGYITPNGERRSIFARNAEGIPHLVAVLLARQLEERGTPMDLRGMPLGFPSVGPAQIQLVESWISQGRPR